MAAPLTSLDMDPNATPETTARRLAASVRTMPVSFHVTDVDRQGHPGDILADALEEQRSPVSAVDVDSSFAPATSTKAAIADIVHTTLVPPSAASVAKLDATPQETHLTRDIDLQAQPTIRSLSTRFSEAWLELRELLRFYGHSDNAVKLKTVLFGGSRYLVTLPILSTVGLLLVTLTTLGVVVAVKRH